MLKNTKLFHHAKTLVVSVIAISLGACAPATETTSTSTDSVTAPTSVATSPQTTTSPPTVAIPGVKDVGEINFKSASPNSSSGFFDGKNGTREKTFEGSRATIFNIGGWAIVANENRPADMVLITYGDTHSLLAVAPVNLERPDVVKVLNNPAYKNSGWSTTLNGSTLPTDKLVLKGWAYNSARKEATPLNNTIEVVVLN